MEPTGWILLAIIYIVDKRFPVNIQRTICIKGTDNCQYVDGQYVGFCMDALIFMAFRKTRATAKYFPNYRTNALFIDRLVERNDDQTILVTICDDKRTRPSVRFRSHITYTEVKDVPPFASTYCQQLLLCYQLYY